MRTFKDIDVLQTIEIAKKDFNDLETFLSKHELIDDNKLWFSGFDNYRKSTNNAVAGNLLYGNKKLRIMCIKDSNVYYVSNSKEGLKVRLLGNTSEKFHMTSMWALLHPTVDITDPNGLLFEFKVTKNKGIIKAFRKALK